MRVLPRQIIKKASISMPKNLAVLQNIQLAIRSCSEQQSKAIIATSTTVTLVTATTTEAYLITAYDNATDIDAMQSTKLNESHYVSITTFFFTPSTKEWPLTLRT